VKREKQVLLDEMKEQIQQSGSFIIAQYQHLNGARAHEFRREIAKVGGYFEVVRKRMLLEAVRLVGVEFDPKQLPGHIGLILGAKDPLEATKVIMKFSQGNEASFQLVGGFVEGQKATKEDVQRLATLPGKDQMRAELLGLFCAPASGVLGVMEALMAGIVHCMDSRANEIKGSDTDEELSNDCESPSL
jgi:large subunit ribosomal protein L10